MSSTKAKVSKRKRNESKTFANFENAFQIVSLDITDWTMVFTNRCLSDAMKMKCNDYSDLRDDIFFGHINKISSSTNSFKT